jgi:hypothetical protein
MIFQHLTLDSGKLREHDPVSGMKGLPRALTIGGPGDIIL